MAIPKHLKKHVKRDFRLNPEKRVKHKRSWSYAVGDLVKVKSNQVWGLVIDQIGSYYHVMTSGGKITVNPGKLERIQPLDAQNPVKKDT